MEMPTSHLPFQRARLAVFAAGMCAFFNMYVTQGLLPSLRPVFHASIAQLSLTISVTTLAVAAAAPMAGSLSDRYGRKRILLLSLAGLSVTTLLAATSPSLYWLLFWRLLEGLCIPGVFTSMIAYIREEWSSTQAPAVTALYVSGTVFGSCCGRILAGVVTAHFNWQTAFVLLGICNLLLLPLIAKGLPASRGFTSSPSLAASLSGLGRHLRNRNLLATYAIGFGILFAQVATFTYVGFHLSTAPFSLSLDQLSMIFIVYLIGAALIPTISKLGPRFGQRRVFVAAMTVGSAGMLLTLGPSLLDVIIGLTLSSGSIFIAQSMATSLVPAYAGHARSLAVGLYVMCYYLGGSIGGVLPSAIWSHAGWLGCVTLVILMQAAIAVIAWKAWRGATHDKAIGAPAAVQRC